ncbi:hypothetical protein J7K93_10885 [bacterium]|nr:hypothetical protein [bacterium]
MKASEQIGSIFIGLWLILSGLVTMLKISNNTLNIAIAVMALVAGVLFLMSRSHIKGRLGTFLLGIWLIGAGSKPVVAVHFPLYTVIFGILAIAAGVLILIDQ